MEESTSISEHKRRHEDISDDDLRSTGQKQSKKREKKKHKKKHDKHHKSTKYDKPSTSKQHDSKPVTIWIEETSLSAKDAFRCDNKPDWSNFSYDSLYSGDLANYRRRFGNYCLGIGDSNIKFTDQRNISTKKKSKLSSTPSRYYQDKVCDSAHVNILLKMEDSNEEIAMMKEFLPVETNTSPSIVDDETPEVYLVKRAGEYNSRLLDNPHDVRLWMEFIDFQDEALIWGKLPSITASTAQLESTNTTATNESIRRQKLALNERKIAIFERALEKNPLSEELLVGHMELVQEIWETERLVKKWKDIVFKQPNRSLLWLKYIEFCQSRFSFYRSSAVASLYQKAISTLTSVINRSLLSHKPEPDAEGRLVALFLLYCYFLKHSGFVEKAVALLQALVEFNLCSPEEFFEGQSLHKIKDRLEVFETFWDGDGARIGEEGAMGWKGWFNHHASAHGVEEHLLGVINEKEIELLITNSNSIGDTSVDISDEEEDKEAEIVRDQPVNIGWAKLEMHREFTSCLPGKLSTEDNDSSSDLDHTILFDDISLCLFLIEDQQLKASLLLEFLRFLGAPICSAPLVSVIYPDTVHMIVDPVEVLLPTITIPLSFESVVPSIVYQPRPLVTDLTSIASSSFYNLLFTDAATSSNVRLPSPLKVFTTRLFNHSSSLLQSLAVSPEIKSSLTCSWLQYELSNIHPDVGTGSSVAECLQKLSISLLQSVSLADYGFMWNFINQLEPLLSNKKKISSLSKALLHPFSLLPSPRGTSLFIFCLLFVECMLKIRQPINCYSKHLPSSDLALFTLVSLSHSEFNPTMLPVSGVKVSSAQLLKAREYFEELSSHVLRLHSNISQPEVSSKLGCCLYFKYLTEGIDSACELIQQFLNVLTACNPQQCNGSVEGLYVMVVQLVEVHSRNNPIKPQIMRDILCSALSQFPHHFWFLRMFIQWEEQSFNTGQLRRFFTSLVQHKNSNGLIPALFAVSAEIGRYTRLNELVGVYMEEPSSGLLQRARSFFIRGSQTKIGGSSPALWRAYIKFEVT